MRLSFVLSLSVALTSFAVAQAAVAADSIEVMTQNQYLGANLDDVATAPDPGTFNTAVVAALEQVAANDLPARAQQLAELIADRLPELVGLQEVYAFSCIDLVPELPPGLGCDDPSIAGAFNDHLGETLAALAALGESYVPVATVKDMDTTVIEVVPGVPGIYFEINGVPAVVNMIDRDVILVRGDLAGFASPVDFQTAYTCLRPSLDGCNYLYVAQANTPAGPLNIERGFVGVDVTVGGRSYRFVDTHLEVREPDEGNPLSRFYQAAQAAELIQTLALTTPPGTSLLVVGDINSAPEDLTIPRPLPFPPPFDQGIVPPYTQFVGSGYTDSWTLRPGNQPGLSCCQASDLSNHQSQHYERIDMIFSLDVPDGVKKARVLGSKVSDKTPPPGLGLWPSDHGSVAAELQFD